METAKAGGFRYLNRDAIKYIAMFTMLLNHIANIFGNPEEAGWQLLISIGYFTAPVMLFFLVEGYSYTHSKTAYLRRLFGFAIISELPFCLALTQDSVIQFCGFNMLFTLCLCFGLIRMNDMPISRSAKAGYAVGTILVSIFCDWGILAPVFTLLFIWAGEDEKRKKTAFAACCLLMGGMNIISNIGWYPAGKAVFYGILNMAGPALAGVFLIYFYNGKKAERGQKFSKWFFYLFYPLHLLLLGLIRVSMI